MSAVVAAGFAVALLAGCGEGVGETANDLTPEPLGQVEGAVQYNDVNGVCAQSLTLFQFSTGSANYGQMATHDRVYVGSSSTVVGDRVYVQVQTGWLAFLSGYANKDYLSRNCL